MAVSLDSTLHWKPLVYLLVLTFLVFFCEEHFGPPQSRLRQPLFFLVCLCFSSHKTQLMLRWLPARSLRSLDLNFWVLCVTYYYSSIIIINFLSFMSILIGILLQDGPLCIFAINLQFEIHYLLTSQQYTDHLPHRLRVFK